MALVALADEVGGDSQSLCTAPSTHRNRDSWFVGWWRIACIGRRTWVAAEEPSIPPHGRAATLAATARSCAPYDLSIALSNNPRRTGVIAAQTTSEPVAVQAAHA
jgi:hypothetical protein